MLQSLCVGDKLVHLLGDLLHLLVGEAEDRPDDGQELVDQRLDLFQQNVQLGFRRCGRRVSA